MTDAIRQISNGDKARKSFQFLRGETHALLEVRFPNKRQRYWWLKRNAPKMHMSEMDRGELEALISTLKRL